MCQLKDFEKLKMDAEHRDILRAELDDWHKKYPHGDTFLDVGAGNGETALFAFNHGSQHVIAIDPEADLLIENFPDAIVVPKNARMVIIPWAINAAKIDGEGCERNLVLETHFPFRIKFLGNSAIVTPWTNLWKIGPETGMKTLSAIRILRIQIAHLVKRSLNLLISKSVSR